MTEDEEFNLLEEEIRRKENIQLIKQAQQEAQEFVEDHADQLGAMTLRKAFEMGYRFGYSDAVMRNRNAKHQP